MALLEWARATTAEQAPLLAQDIVRYGVASNSFQVALCLTLTVIGVVIVWRFVRRDEGYNPGQEIIAFISGVVAFFAGLGVIVNGNYLLMAITAPRLYVLHVLSTLGN